MGIPVTVATGVEGRPGPLTGGSVTNIQASGCQSYMAGDVQITDNSYVAPGSVGGQWISRLQINGSPDSCQGQAVSYDINLTAGS